MKIDLERRIVQLTQKIKGIPKEEVADIVELASNNEWGLALDTLCFQLDECNLKITIEQYNEIMNLGREMHMEESLWLVLKRLVRG